MAYAAVISLKHNIEHLIHPTTIVEFDPQITKHALDQLNYLEAPLQALDIKGDQRFDIGAIKALHAEIREAVWRLEDALESYSYAFYYYNGCRPQKQRQVQMQIPLVDREGVEQEIRSFLAKVKPLMRKFQTLLDHPLVGEEEDGEEEIPDFGGNKASSKIGLTEDRFREINKEVVDTQQQRKLKVVSLVGMAGIGKTHFATQIYQQPYIDKHFHYTAWVRVGQKGRVRNILADILAQIERKPANYRRNVHTLGYLLTVKLKGKKCLIVLDDMWSQTVYDDIIYRLQEAGVRRVLLTTRVRHINKYKRSKIYEMRFLDDEESWNLLWQNVFPERSSFPPQLGKVGRKIAAKCEGLPLLILVVAHLLRGVDKTEEYWSKVADKKTSTFVDAYDRIYKLLFPSYEYLPEKLKTCFLYMGVFPQSSEIPLSKLINLLMVEDFLEPALEYGIVESVEKLVSNSLVIVCKQGYYGYRVKSCKLHSVYWYLCVNEARKNKFLHVLNRLSDGAKVYIESQRRLSVQNSILFGIKEAHDSIAAASTARSLLCTGEDHEYPVPICFNLMLLRVLDVVSIRLYEFPEEVVKLLLLRYLSLTYNGKLPPSVSHLQHLKCLIIRQHHNIKLITHSHSTFLPDQIWDMQQLKHLRIMQHNLPDPANGTASLPNLETLYMNAHSCTEAVFRSLPNLKKLGIAIELQPEEAVGSSSSFIEHIWLLHELESLKCVVVNPWLMRSHFVAPLSLSNLRGA